MKYEKTMLNYSFDIPICHVISIWSSSFFLSQFGPYFFKNNSSYSIIL